MKALSIRQPWAWAIIYAGKNVENRSWVTDYRGPLLIHASKRFDFDGFQWMHENAEDLGLKSAITHHHLIPLRHEFYKGGIIGKVYFKKLVRSKSFSRWMFGPWGWLLENPESIPFIPYRGKLGLFDIPDEIINQRLK